MSECEQESEFSIVFRFAENVLNLFFTEGESWNYFDLRWLDDFCGVLRDPVVLDAEGKERTEMSEFFGSRDRTKRTALPVKANAISLKLSNERFMVCFAELGKAI